MTVFCSSSYYRNNWNSYKSASAGGNIYIYIYIDTWLKGGEISGLWALSVSTILACICENGGSPQIILSEYQVSKRMERNTSRMKG
jgi:hypothetical protein